MEWCTVAPFFIGSIFRGRTMCQIILGGYAFGIVSALISFIVLGNYSMGIQLAGKMNFITPYLENGDKHGVCIHQTKTEDHFINLKVSHLPTMLNMAEGSFV